MKTNEVNNQSGIWLMTVIALCAFKLDAQTVTTFSYSGSVQNFTVPQCVTTMSFDVRGARGGQGYDVYSAGGTGGRISGVMAVTAGQVLEIRVGGAGVHGTQGVGGAGGFNGGGTGASYSGLYGGGGGGGASDIRLSPYTLSDRIVVAGGGGGGAYNYSSVDYDRGGMGGGTTGEAGRGGNSYSTAGGGGGTQSAGGVAGFYSGYCTASTGSFGIGGAGGTCNNSGGGGGGGYYGGGGGVWGGGGGGSNYASATFSSVVHVQGSQTGNGLVVLTYTSNGNPITAVSSPTAICTGGSATLSASGAGTYTWNTNANTSAITVNPGSTTSYTVSGTNASACISYAILTVTVTSGLPVLTVNSSTNNICLGKSVTLTASGGLTHTWTGGISNGVAFYPSVTNTYTVTGTNGCGSATAVTTVSVLPLPVAVYPASTLVCQLKPVTLYASGGSTYTWMPGAGSQPTLLITPTVSTVYTVSASNGTCMGSATIAVNTKPNPTITATASNSMICGGESVTLTATGADSYTWNPAAISGSTGVVNPVAPTLYQVTGSNSVGCIATAAQVVVVKATPTIAASASHTLVCLGGTATLTAVGNADAYTWSTGAGTASINVSPGSAGAYTVTGTNTTSGCSTTQAVFISVYQPVLPASPSTTICMGSPVTLTAGPGTGYIWSNGSSSFNYITVSPSLATTYSVSAITTSNNISCLGTNTIHVDVNPKPVVIAVATRTALCRFESTTLTASGAVTYSWSNNNMNASFSFSSNIVLLHNIFVIGTDANGCKDTSTIQVRVNSCTGVEELSATASALLIYPNPGKGEFTVVAGSEATLFLMNELGQVVKTVSLGDQNQFTVRLKDLAAGIYFLSGTIDHQSVSRKIIVSR